MKTKNEIKGFKNLALDKAQLTMLKGGNTNIVIEDLIEVRSETP